MPAMEMAATTRRTRVTIGSPYQCCQEGTRRGRRSRRDRLGVFDVNRQWPAVPAARGAAKSGETTQVGGFSTYFVGLTRVELVTSPLSGVRSNQLSYSPEANGNDTAQRDKQLLLLWLHPHGFLFDDRDTNTAD